MPKKYNKKKQYFLDVAQYILGEPYQGTPSPKISASPYEYNDVRLIFNKLSFLVFNYQLMIVAYQKDMTQIKTPHNLPYMIEFEGNKPSPYLKQLLKNPQIQFYDFTLEGPQESDFDQDECKYLDQDAIIEEEQNQKSDQEQNLEYVDDITYTEPSRLNLKTFRAILQEFKNIQLSDQEVRIFVQEYLTEDDIQRSKQKTNQDLIQIAEYNLRPCGVISWLQRRNKVGRYLQKKKRRIWNKKINYDCRKKVAQNRLRIKGKFVTQEQACQMLGLRDTTTIEQIKVMLEQKYKG